jgi:hypothetical protein
MRKVIAVSKRYISLHRNEQKGRKTKERKQGTVYLELEQ